LIDIHLRNRLIALSGLAHDDFDQRHVAVVNYGETVSWAAPMQARTLVSIDPRNAALLRRGAIKLDPHTLYLSPDTLDGQFSAFFDVVFLSFTARGGEQARAHIEAVTALLAEGGRLVVDGDLIGGHIDPPEIPGFAVNDLAVSGRKLQGKMVKPGGRNLVETDVVRLQYRMDIKPRWTLQKPNEPIKAILDKNAEFLSGTLEEYRRFMPDFLRIGATRTNDTDPYWANGWFPMLDGISLYAETVLREPDYYFEIGSGNSTKFVARAIRDHKLKTRIVSVDPHPRAEIDALCERVHRMRFEDFDLAELLKLRDSKVFLFMDGSHYALPNSDATIFFLDLLPEAPSHWLFGIHDVIWPYDYLNRNMRFYSEQYVLAPFLLSGSIDAVFAASYLTLDPQRRDQTAAFLEPIKAMGGGWAGGGGFLFESYLN
jgi:hypothetical protein